MNSVLALREAERWDECRSSPRIGSLTEPGKGGVSEVARELTRTAATEEYGARLEWKAIPEGVFDNAGNRPAKIPAVRFREVDQATFATFLHSLPIGQKVLTRDLMVLVGATRPAKIELEKRSGGAELGLTVLRPGENQRPSIVATASEATFHVMASWLAAESAPVPPLR